MSVLQKPILMLTIVHEYVIQCNMQPTWSSNLIMRQTLNSQQSVEFGSNNQSI